MAKEKLDLKKINLLVFEDLIDLYKTANKEKWDSDMYFINNINYGICCYLYRHAGFLEQDAFLQWYKKRYCENSYISARPNCPSVNRLHEDEKINTIRQSNNKRIRVLRNFVKHMKRNGAPDRIKPIKYNYFSLTSLLYVLETKYQRAVDYGWDKDEIVEDGLYGSINQTFKRHLSKHVLYNKYKRRMRLCSPTTVLRNYMVELSTGDLHPEVIKDGYTSEQLMNNRNLLSQVRIQLEDEN